MHSSGEDSTEKVWKGGDLSSKTTGQTFCPIKSKLTNQTLDCQLHQVAAASSWGLTPRVTVTCGEPPMLRGGFVYMVTVRCSLGNASIATREFISFFPLIDSLGFKCLKAAQILCTLIKFLVLN